MTFLINLLANPNSSYIYSTFTPEILSHFEFASCRKYFFNFHLILINLKVFRVIYTCSELIISAFLTSCWSVFINDLFMHIHKKKKKKLKLKNLLWSSRFESRNPILIQEKKLSNQLPRQDIITVSSSSYNLHQIILGVFFHSGCTPHLTMTSSPSNSGI